MSPFDAARQSASDPMDDREDDLCSLQPLGDGQVLVSYCIRHGDVVLDQVYIENAELTCDAEEFSLSVRTAWRRAIQAEYDKEHA